VDPVLVEMFDKVVSHAKDGDPAATLAGYRKVLEVQRTKKLKAIPRFLATVHLQAGYSLIDLKKLKEAEAELKLIDPLMFKGPQRYDYYFTLGNVLGGERKVKPMFSAFVEAIGASEDAGDMETRPQACWNKILGFTMVAEDWPYLKEVSDKALQVAGVRGFTELQKTAQVAREEANKHLKK